MFQFNYADSDVKQKICNHRQRFWDEILEEELSPVLKDLMEKGEVSSRYSDSVYRGITIFGERIQLKGQNFRLLYSVNSKEQKIKFYDCEFLSQSQRIDWSKLMLQNNIELSLDNEIVLPQLGIKRMINALQCIAKGAKNSYELGLCSGSKATSKKGIQRHGQYDTEFLKSIGLIEIDQTNREWSYSCSKFIEASILKNDLETTYRLIAEALFGFPVIRRVIEHTTDGQKELSIELIESTFKEFECIRYGKGTPFRRSQSIRSLINWLAREAGIPIRREGSKYIQPFLNLDVYESQIE